MYSITKNNAIINPYWISLILFFFYLSTVQKVFNGDCFERAIEYGQKLADNVSPTSLAAMKRQLWTHPGMQDEAALRESNVIMKSSLSVKNAGENELEEWYYWNEKTKAKHWHLSFFLILFFIFCRF